MSYIYEIYDGDEWVIGDPFIYPTAEAAKKAGVDAGFEYVRVKGLPKGADDGR